MRFKLYLLAGVPLFPGAPLCSIVFSYSPAASAQQPDLPITLASSSLPEAPSPQAPAAPQSDKPELSRRSPSPAQNPDSNSASEHKPPPQPKRILGIMPNYRAVSAGAIPPPPTPREAFKIATREQFRLLIVRLRRHHFAAG